MLKDGVDWQFIGRPVISSDSGTGTFYDNGADVELHFIGDPVIINTTGFNNIIILGTSSYVDYELSLLCKATLYGSDGAFSTLDIIGEDYGLSAAASFTNVSGEIIYTFTFGTQFPGKLVYSPDNKYRRRQDPNSNMYINMLLDIRLINPFELRFQFFQDDVTQIIMDDEIYFTLNISFKKQNSIT